MSTFTADQIALQNHIEAANASWVAVCEARGDVFYTTIVSDPDHWADYGITTIAQYERQQTIGAISDTYKDVYGVRPRHLDTDSMSDTELKVMLESLYDDMNRQAVYEAEREAWLAEETKWCDRLSAERERFEDAVLSADDPTKYELMAEAAGF